MCAGLHLGDVVLTLDRIGRSGHLQSGLKQPGLVQRTLSAWGTWNALAVPLARRRLPDSPAYQGQKPPPPGFTKPCCHSLRGGRVEAGLPVCSSHVGPNSWIQPRQLDQSNDFRKQGEGGSIDWDSLYLNGSARVVCYSHTLGNGSVELMTRFHFVFKDLH